MRSRCRARGLEAGTISGGAARSTLPPGNLVTSAFNPLACRRRWMWQSLAAAPVVLPLPLPSAWSGRHRRLPSPPPRGPHLPWTAASSGTAPAPLVHSLRSLHTYPTSTPLPYPPPLQARPAACGAGALCAAPAWRRHHGCTERHQGTGGNTSGPVPGRPGPGLHPINHQV